MFLSCCFLFEHSIKTECKEIYLNRFFTSLHKGLLERLRKIYCFFFFFNLPFHSVSFDCWRLSDSYCGVCVFVIRSVYFTTAVRVSLFFPAFTHITFTGLEVSCRDSSELTQSYCMSHCNLFICLIWLSPFTCTTFMCYWFDTSLMINTLSQCIYDFFFDKILMEYEI